jgi:hypothetical protein
VAVTPLRLKLCGVVPFAHSLSLVGVWLGSQIDPPLREPHAPSSGSIHKIFALPQDTGEPQLLLQVQDLLSLPSAQDVPLPVQKLESQLENVLPLQSCFVAHEVGLHSTILSPSIFIQPSPEFPPDVASDPEFQENPESTPFESIIVA